MRSGRGEGVRGVWVHFSYIFYNKKLNSFN